MSKFTEIHRIIAGKVFFIDSPPKIMLKMEKREMLKRPSVQHVAANIRLKPNGHSVVFEFIWRCVPLLLVRFDADVSMSPATLIVLLCGVVLIKY